MPVVFGSELFGRQCFLAGVGLSDIDDAFLGPAGQAAVPSGPIAATDVPGNPIKSTPRGSPVCTFQ